MLVPSNGVHQNGVRKHLNSGIYVPTVAFFDRATDEVDVATTKKHAVRLANARVTGLVTHGSNGEAVHLDHSERMLSLTGRLAKLSTLLAAKICP
jgi:dihydrodipicolinate synthase/N-acetylneuraminate lyase